MLHVISLCRHFVDALQLELNRKINSNSCSTSNKTTTTTDLYIYVCISVRITCDYSCICLEQNNFKKRSTDEGKKKLDFPLATCSTYDLLDN